jgi:quinoprotein glucose dehydrogenase
MRRFCFWLALSVAAMGADSTGESHYFGSDAGASKYWPFDQINANNVQNLKIAWRRPAIDAKIVADHPDLKFSNNLRAAPIMAGGVLYSSDALGMVEAMDPATGRTLWIQEPPVGPLMQADSSRAIAFWSRGEERRVVTVRGPYLMSLDAKTGKTTKTFGDNGMVDLGDGSGTSHFLWRSPGPLVVKDVIVVGGQSVRNEAEYEDVNLPGDVRGFDVHTGKLLWTFHTIPREGEFGTDTWLNDSWKNNGKAKVWSLLSADEELGYVYAPLSAAANDWYGGRRPGANLFSDSLVCIDARTGKRVWHYQLVHHDLWDYDLPTAPILADLNVGGKKIKAVLQVTKMAYVFAFDRVTGKPIWPIEERPVPASNVPGEWTSPTQPFPTKPAPFDRIGFTDDDLIDFTPELHGQAVEIMSRYVHGQIFTPPSLKGNDKLGTIYLPGWVGGANWTGAAIDPETKILYIPSVSVPWLIGLVKMDKGDWRRAQEKSLYPDGPQGLPLVKPPYGRITAIDMNRGEHVWMVPNGDGPRNHPLLKDLHLPPLGQPGRVAPLLTKTLLFLGEGDMVGLSMPPFSGGNMFRAYDKRTGRVLWEKDLDAGTTGAPMSYMYQGKQYIVVAVGGVKHSPELVALALP